MLQTWDKLTLKGDDGAAIILIAPFNDNMEDARKILRQFLKTDLERIETTLTTNQHQK